MKGDGGVRCVRDRVGGVEDGSKFPAGGMQGDRNMPSGGRMLSGTQGKPGGTSRVQWTKVFGAEGEDVCKSFVSRPWLGL